jgi:multidrug resistance efflux pump
MTEEGEWVRVGDPLFALADARDLYIEVNAPERHFNPNSRRRFRDRGV